METRDHIMRYIRSHWQRHLTSPTLREIMYACNISAHSVVDHHIKALKKTGDLLDTPGRKSRSFIPSNMKITFEEVNNEQARQ